jgi:glycerophosphoryl diester phosphodiesterase
MRLLAFGPMKRAFIVAALVCIAGCSTTPTFDLQGHRGARGLAPENTLVAFDRALALGVTTLELDAALTKDGVVVITHDPTLNPAITRDAEGRWIDTPGPAIASLTLAELQRYDVGRLKPDTAYARGFPEQQPADGTRIPTLAALFERVKAIGDNRVRFNIETKLTPMAEGPPPEAFAKAVLDVIRQHGMSRRVTLQSFDWRTLQAMNRLAPEIPTVCLTVQQDRFNNVVSGAWTAGLKLADHGDSVPRLVKAAGCSVWSPFFREVTSDILYEAKTLGLKTVVWTVNEPTHIEVMLELGVDGIISDRPDLVRTIMQAGGLRLPPPNPRAGSL